MKKITAILGALLLVGVSACQEKATDPPTEQPAADQMSFKTGARYEFETYRTDAQTNAKTDSSRNLKVMTLVNANATVKGRTGAAIYSDSVFSIGGVFDLMDSTIIQQQSGSNDIYRYASLAPELDFSGIALFDVGLGEDWRHEAKLGATSALWEVGQLADTFTYDDLPTGINGIVVKLKDSAVASSKENITIGGQSYAATKTTHRISLNFTILTSLGIPINLPSAESLTRTTWIVPTLGVIAREERQGKVLNLTIPGGAYTVPPIPVPGYVSIMTRVIAAGG